MSIHIAESDLPLQLTAEQAVEAAYAAELAEAASKLVRGLPVLVECDKDLAPFLFVQLRGRLKSAGLKCTYLDGRGGNAQQKGMSCGLVRTTNPPFPTCPCRGGQKRVRVLPRLGPLPIKHGCVAAEAPDV